MFRLKITIKERILEKVTVYVDDREVGVIHDEIDVELPDEPRVVYVKYGEKTSNTLKLKNRSNKEYKVQISRMNQIGRWLLVFFNLFLTSFAAHMSIGIGYYVFISVSLLLFIMMYLNRGKLVLIQKRR